MKMVLYLLYFVINHVIISNSNKDLKCKIVVIYRICKPSDNQFKRIINDAYFINKYVQDHCSIIMQDTGCRTNNNNYTYAQIIKKRKIFDVNINISTIKKCYPNTNFNKLPKSCIEQNRNIMGHMSIETLTTIIYCNQESVASKFFKKTINVWLIEEDAILLGNKSYFFNYYNTKKNIDLITSNGPKWATLQADLICPYEKNWWAAKIRNFGNDDDVMYCWLFVARFSKRLLSTIHHEYLSKGFTGHAEMLPPTACHKSLFDCKMYKIEDRFIGNYFFPWEDKECKYECIVNRYNNSEQNKPLWFHPVKNSL